MGIQDRDYMREHRNNDEPPVISSRRWWLFFGIAIALSIVFIAVERQTANKARQTQSRPAIVNVNSASLAELRTLPRISEITAQAVIDGRPYSSVDDLIRVYGIGPKTLELIRPYVKVKDENPKPAPKGGGR